MRCARIELRGTGRGERLLVSTGGCSAGVAVGVPRLFAGCNIHPEDVIRICCVVGVYVSAGLGVWVLVSRCVLFCESLQ